MQAQGLYESYFYGDTQKTIWKFEGGFPYLNDLRQNNSNFKHELTYIFELCALILVTNLASPEVLYIDCNRKLAFDFICMGMKNNQSSAVEEIRGKHPQKYCGESQILKQSKCFKFLFDNSINQRNIFQKCEAYSMELLIFHNVTMYLNELDILTLAVPIAPIGAQRHL